MSISTAEGLHAAISAANSPYVTTEITLGASVTTTEEIVVDAEGAQIVLDLNGQTLTLGASVTVKQGSLTVKNGTLYTGSRVSAFHIPEDASDAKLTFDTLSSNESVTPQSPTFDFRSGTVLWNACSFCRISNISSTEKGLNFEFNGVTNAWFSSVIRVRGNCNFTVKDSILETRTGSGVIKNTSYFRAQLATDSDFTGTVTFDNSSLHGARVCAVLYGTGTVRFTNGSKVIPQTFTYSTSEDKSVALVLGPNAIRVGVENSTVSANWQAIAVPHATLTATPVVTLKDAVVCATNSTANKNASSAVFGGHSIEVDCYGATLLGDALFSSTSCGNSGPSNLTSLLAATAKTYSGGGLTLRVSAGEVDLMCDPTAAEHVTLAVAEGLHVAKRSALGIDVPYVYNATTANYYSFMSKTNTLSVALSSPYLITDNAVKVTWDYTVGHAEEYWVKGQTPTADTYTFSVNGNGYVASFENVGVADADVTYLATGITGGPKLSSNLTLYAAIDFNVYVPVTASELTHVNGYAVETLPTVTENGVTYYKLAFADLAPKDAYKSQRIVLTVVLAEGAEPVEITRYASILGYAKAVAAQAAEEEIAVVTAALNYINETRKYFYNTTEEIEAISEFLGDYSAVWDGADNVLTLPEDLSVVKAIALNLDACPGFAVSVDPSYEGEIRVGSLLPRESFFTTIDLDGESLYVRCAVFDVPVHKMLDNFIITAGSDSFTFNLDTYIASVASHEGYAAALSDYAKRAKEYKAVKADLYYTAEAQIVNKDGAEGVVSYVIDDNDRATATFANSLLDTYSNLALSYAIRTKYLATLLTEEGEDGLLHYRMSEDGAYLYTTDDDAVAFWRDITASERVELVNHTHTHAFWGTNDDGGEFKYLKSSDTSTVLTSTQPVGSSSKEIYAAQQILADLFGDLDTASRYSFVQAGIGVFTGTKEVDGETIVSYNTYFKQLLADAIENDELISARKTFSISNTSSESYVVTKDSFTTTNGRANVNSYMILNANAGENVENWTAYIDHALAQGGWAPFCIHLIRENEVSSHHILQSQADALFAYTASLGDRVWVATYTDASMYYAEWSSASVDISYESGALTVTLTDGENDEVFNMPLTVKISVPPSFEGRATVDGEELTVYQNADGTYYAYVNIVPDSGSVTVVGG